MRCLAISYLALLLLGTAAHAQSGPAYWSGFAGNAQHTAGSAVAPQPFAHIRWRAKVDDAPGLIGGELLVHYGSPMITAANTVLLPVKGTSTGGFSIEAREGATGARLWRLATDYVLPGHDWMPPLPAALSARNLLYVAGAGGTVLVRATPDDATGTVRRQAFFGMAAYNADTAGYDAAVQIATPLTADAAGNIYFGFVATGAAPGGLHSGIARLTPQGAGSWVAATAAASDPGITQVAMNAAPALSADGATLYVAVSNGSAGYLLGLDSATLATKYKVALADPASGWAAWVSDDSSASPTVGPDGDVYYGVLEQPFPSHNDRGWLLHFDATLTTTKIPGSFGWDSTASVVPAALVPSYKGAASYLLMTKYNNYLGSGTGDGHNRIAVIDPTASQPDPFAATPTRSMAVVESLLSPRPFPGAPAGARYEWCLNSAAVDLAGGTVIANSEAGVLYHWDLKTGAISEKLALNQPRPEAYTMTVIGPDGTVYAINNALLYAIGQ